MCSSDFGPAIVPSLVMWPMRKIGTERRLAADISRPAESRTDRKSTRLNSSHRTISYAVFCLKKKNVLVDGAFERPSSHFHRKTFFKKKYERGRFPIYRKSTIFQAPQLHYHVQLFPQDDCNQI